MHLIAISTSLWFVSFYLVFEFASRKLLAFSIVSSIFATVFSALPIMYITAKLIQSPVSFTMALAEMFFVHTLFWTIIWVAETEE